MLASIEINCEYIAVNQIIIFGLIIATIKPCKKDCVEDKKICNFASGRCIKQKN